MSLGVAIGVLVFPVGGIDGSASAALVGKLPTVSATAAVAAGGPDVSCVGAPSTWSVAARVNQLLLVGGQFSDLAASASEASAGVGGFVLFGQPPAGSGPSIRSGTA